MKLLQKARAVFILLILFIFALLIDSLFTLIIPYQLYVSFGINSMLIYLGVLSFTHAVRTYSKALKAILEK